jgi:hypothetical protein
MISSLDDVENFIDNYRLNDVSLLSELTDGVHLHTIEVVNKQVLNLIKEKLEEKGLLLSD